MYLFAHALIRDAIYDTLLTSRRRKLHRRAADWYARQRCGAASDVFGAPRIPKPPAPIWQRLAFRRPGPAMMRRCG